MSTPGTTPTLPNYDAYNRAICPAFFKTDGAPCRAAPDRAVGATSEAANRGRPLEPGGR